jgi:hypothetical protein
VPLALEYVGLAPNVPTTMAVPGVPGLVPIGQEGLRVAGSSTRRDGEAAGASERLLVVDCDLVTSGTAGHCVFWLDSGQVLVADLGSDNGTWIERHPDGERHPVGTTKRPSTVQEGDLIYIGPLGFRLTRT